MQIKETKKPSVNRQRTICVMTDWLTTFVAFFCFNVFRFYYMKLGNSGFNLSDYLFSDKLITEQVLVPVLLLFVYWISGYYNKPFERSRLKEFLLTFYSQLFNATVIYLGALTNDQMYLRRENWMLLLILFLLLFLFTYIGRIIVTERLRKKMSDKRFRPRTVMIGISDEARNVARRLSEPGRKNGVEIIGFMPFGNEKESKLTFEEESPRIYDIEGLKELCREKLIDQVIIVPTSGKSPSKKVLYLLYHLYPFDISIKINPDILSIITPSIKLEDIMGEPFIDLASPRIGDFSKNVKRTIDVLVAGIGMIVLFPLFASLALGVKLSGPGKIIYSQERIGIHRKPFKIHKFRSMIPEAENDGVPRLSSDKDQRITKIGKWLRKYRLDELPQLWNVLKGEMSLVGPRPEREYFIDKIIKKAPWYTMVLQVRPGITSWGMVKFGYATDIDQMIERNRYDLLYLANMSVAVDIKILIHTIKTVGSGSGK